MQVFEHLAEATKLLEKTNAELEPQLLTAAARRELMSRFARAEKLVAYGKTSLASVEDDPAQLARVSGSSIGKAKATVETAKALQDADEVSAAFRSGEVSLDQAAEITKAEKAAPGSSSELLQIAATESFNVLKERSRRVVLEAEQTRGLAERQREARVARNYEDDLGMVTINLRLTPHLGSAIVNRAEAEARRLQSEAKREGRSEPFERHLADAYGAMLAGAGTKRAPSARSSSCW